MGCSSGKSTVTPSTSEITQCINNHNFELFAQTLVKLENYHQSRHELLLYFGHEIANSSMCEDSKLKFFTCLTHRSPFNLNISSIDIFGYPIDILIIAMSVLNITNQKNIIRHLVNNDYSVNSTYDNNSMLMDYVCQNSSVELFGLLRSLNARTFKEHMVYTWIRVPFSV